jgi:hypothetical protein
LFQILGEPAQLYGIGIVFVRITEKVVFKENLEGLKLGRVFGKCPDREK